MEWTPERKGHCRTVREPWAVSQRGRQKLIVSSREDRGEEWEWPQRRILGREQCFDRQPGYLEGVAVMLEEITDHPGELIPSEKVAARVHGRKVKMRFVEE